MDIFSGSLEKIKIGELIGILHMGKQTGLLSVVAASGEGGVYFTNGEIVHAHFAGNEGLDALVDILDLNAGSYTFVAGESAPRATIESPMARLKEEMKRLRSARAKVLELIPSKEVVLKLSDTLDTKEIKLDRETWRILAHLDGVSNVGQVGERLNMSFTDLRRRLSRLVESGMLVSVEVGPASRTQPSSINGDFISALRGFLTDALGPMAEVVLEDVLEEMGESLDALPRSRAAELVEVLAAEIPRDEKRLAFQKAMLDLLSRVS